ncbi:MAG: hypothetical protein CMJ28_03810 [Phycisphaerae bacterium]|nr:hypothetical protein [Phycisphaerae bacterium]
MSVFAEYAAAVPGLMLAGCRGAGLLFVAPGVSSPLVPGVVRVLLGLMLGVVAFGSLDQIGPSPQTLLELGVLSGFELVFGAALGLLALIPIAALQGVGLVSGQQIGLGFATLYDPNIGEEVDTTGRFMAALALGLFVLLGIPEALFLAVREGMMRFPPGVTLDMALMAEALPALIDGAFEVLLRCSLPVLTIVLAQTILMGFLGRSVPQINILSVGFLVRIPVGLLVFLLVLPAMAGPWQTFAGEMIGAVRLLAGAD